MEFSAQQNKALSQVNRWLQQPSTTPEDRLFRLFGYAGTGKTTLAKHLASGVEGEVIFAAYTGKAAKVLRDKGCDEACTVHSLIYQPKIKSEARLRDIQEALRDAKAKKHTESIARLTKLLKKEQDSVSKPSFQLRVDSKLAFARLLILDEVSMIDGQMAEDLMSFGVPILALGDPFQLPPVGKGGYFTEHEPDFMLTDVHRQSADSPVLAMATMIRTEKKLPAGSYGESLVIENQRPDPDLVMSIDQILVGRNKTKFNCNMRMRHLLNRADESPYPVTGDRLVCLKNNHDEGFMNGALFECVKQTGLYEDLVQVRLLPEGETWTQDVTMFTAPFLGDEPAGSWFDQKDTDKFDYGYALTCHKAQGSQWESVLVFDEGHTFGGTSRWRWLYTAVTRAANKVVVVK